MRLAEALEEMHRGLDSVGVQRDPVGAGTPSWRQMPRAVGGLISV
jgi:hypothetical protein